MYPGPILTLIIILLSSTLITALNNRPVIGILTRTHLASGDEHILASYVKWLESVGARSIPILSDASDTVIESIFHQVNGVLFPGAEFQPMPRAVYKIWDLAVAANEDGNDRFPLWGTCNGFENMVSVASDRGEDILSEIIMWNTSIPLNYTNDIHTYDIHTSQLYSNTHIRRIASTQNVTFNNHQMGISPHDFLSDNRLSAMFKITSVNVNGTGYPFVSSMEARDTERYPFYGVQWHPEKNNFEYGTISGDDPYENINHSAAAVEVSLMMAKVFVNEARKSSHVYKDVDLYPLVWSYEMIRGVGAEQTFIIRRGKGDNDWGMKDDNMMMLRG